MDPVSAFQELSNSFDQKEWETALYHADELISWLEKGGFSPFSGLSINVTLKQLRQIRDRILFEAKGLRN